MSKKPSNPKPPARPRRRPEAERLAQKRGLAPGSAVYTGDVPESPSVVTLIRYDPESCEERTLAATEAAEPPDAAGVSWFDVVGLSDGARIAQLRAAFRIHPLTVEDLLNVSTPAKAEEIAGHIFVVIPMTTLGTGDALPTISTEHMSILAGPGWVLTFQENPGDVFGALRDRLRSGSGRARGRGADYLLHALCDSIVDGWFVVLAAFEEQVIALEERAVSGDTDGELPQSVHTLTSRLHALRRRMWPVLGALSELLRMETDLVEARTVPFLRDLHDHARQAVEILDGARDRLNAVLQLHLAMQGHRMNEVMRLLTIVATIFIPLTFVAGIYGMNFRVMPELQWAWGYPVALLVMGLIAAGMVAWFRDRGWF